MLLQVLNSLKTLFLQICEKFGFVHIIYYNGDKLYKKYAGDAGYDLHIADDVVIPAKSGIDIKIDTVIYSKHFWFFLTGRSSTMRKYNLLVHNGIIDNGYTGNLNVYVTNITDVDILLKKGNRICQVIPFKIRNCVVFNGVNHAKIQSERGSSGFGSTGQN